MEKLTNIERYERFMEDNKNFHNMFTYHKFEKGGLFPQWKSSIINFEKETGYFKNLGEITNSKDFYKAVNVGSLVYAAWVDNRKPGSYDLLDLQNFFKGVIGEYFFMLLMNEVGCFEIMNYKSGKLERYDFKYICPRFASESDYGCDLTGVVARKDRSYNCAVQVKFWNPEDQHHQIVVRHAQSLYADASHKSNRFINPEEDKNLIICWLGIAKNVSMCLQRCNLYSDIVFIDNSVLDRCINNKIPHFWSILQKKLSEIADIVKNGK